jgi:hypothetical protein
MDRKKLLEYLDRHGGKLEDWPDEAARDARKLLANCQESRRSFGACRRIEAWLESTRPSIDSICTTRVVSRALRDIRDLPPRRTVFDRLRPVFAIPAPRLAFAALATAVGFAVGLWLGSPGADLTAGPHGLPVIASAGDVLF